MSSHCPDCQPMQQPIARRVFLKRVGFTAAAAAAGPSLWTPGKASAAPTPSSASETAVKALYETLTDAQKKEICFPWDYVDSKRGELRTFVANNWHITEPAIDSDFFTRKQKHLIRDIFDGLFHPDWRERFVKQLKDDTFGKPWGADQNIAIFGKPGEDKFQFVMTGRHMTVRADGNHEQHMAFGGPIFHGHAAESFNEGPNHPGNIFWPQAVLANQVCDMLDGKQRELALVKEAPIESDVPFREKKRPGIPVTELKRDQKELLEKVLASLIEPYRQEDRDEVIACLKRTGGLDACSLAFYQEGDIGNDKVWDNWRLEGPAFVWYFRGSPHVHIWINVADDAKVKLNEKV